VTTQQPLFLRSQPPRHIVSNYCVWSVEQQKTIEKTTLLLADGWWGWVRHPQYVFELGLAYTWGVLANPWSVDYVDGQPWTMRVLALLYPLYLTVLLIGRCHRDTAKCRRKYGAQYKEYEKLVPYQMIWGVF